MQILFWFFCNRLVSDFFVRHNICSILSVSFCSGLWVVGKERKRINPFSLIPFFYSGIWDSNPPLRLSLLCSVIILWLWFWSPDDLCSDRSAAVAPCAVIFRIIPVSYQIAKVETHYTWLWAFFFWQDITKWSGRTLHEKTFLHVCR